MQAPHWSGIRSPIRVLLIVMNGWVNQRLYLSVHKADPSHDSVITERSQCGMCPMTVVVIDLTPSVKCVCGLSLLRIVHLVLLVLKPLRLHHPPHAESCLHIPLTDRTSSSPGGIVPYQINFPSFCPSFVSSRSLPYLTSNPYSLPRSTSFPSSLSIGPFRNTCLEVRSPKQPRRWRGSRPCVGWEASWWTRTSSSCG